MLWLLAFLLILAPASAETLQLDEWTGLAPDPAVTYRGKPALAWNDIARVTRVEAKGAPADWTRFKTLRFATHVAKPTDSVITLVIDSGNPETEGADYYSFTFTTDFTGWREFQVSLDAMASARQPVGWHQIRWVAFSSNWAHRLDPETVLHLANFTLDTEPIPGNDRPAGELLANRSFELDTNYDGRPEGWGVSTWDTGSQVALDTQVARTGRCSMRIDGDPQGRAGLSVGFGPEETDPKAVYLLSAWVKVEGESTHQLRTSARITSVGPKGEVLKSDYRLCQPGAYDWRYHEWAVILPPETTRFNLVLFHHGAGRAWWDDVSLRKAVPAKALGPAQDAVVRDGRPLFQWDEVPGQAVLEIAPEGDFAPDRVRRYPVTGNRFQLPEALPLGKEYSWRVLATGPDGSLRVTLATGADGQPADAARFFAGNWEQRMGELREKLQPYQELLAPLQALARRNRMWDPFKLLAETIAKGEKLATTEPANPREARAELDADLAEIELAAPWWRRIFLDDAALFEGLDLDRPGLEKVKAAVARQEWPAARQALLEYYRARKTPSYYAQYEDPPVRNPAVTTDARADALLTHKFPIHSYKEPTFDLGPDFNWHVHPIIDVEWPTKIHRCFHWSTLAAAYRQTGNEKYAEEIVQQLLDFGKDNPMEPWSPERRRFAWSTLNATVRIYSSWIDSWLQIRESPHWTADAQFVFLTLLREHGRFLMEKQAKHGNWVVAEAQGLVELGIMFPEFKEAKTWRDEGYRRLQRELEIQVLSDGVHVERTPGYHLMTLNCFMRPVQLGLLNKVDVPGRDRFVQKLEQMHEFYLYGSKPNRRMEQIGDSGMMAVDSPLRRGWQMFRREDMLWVLTEGREGKPPVHRSYAFSGGGFYVSRSAWNDPNALWSIVDWGGFLGHCHEDMGHLSVYAYGTELLIDTGIYAYAWPIRAPFYQTSGHNTVMVDEKTQKRRDPLSAKWVSTDQFDLFYGTTDNSEPLIHERTVAFRQPNEAGPGYWLVVDRLTGEGKHRLDQRWHATERLTAKAEGATVTLTGKPESEAQPSLVIAGLPQPGMQTAIVDGAVSYSWYKKTPVEVTQFTLDQEMPAGFVTLLYPTPPGVPPAKVTLEPVTATRDGGQGAVTAVVATIVDRDRRFRDLWLVNHAGEGVIRVGDLETDARVLFFREEGAKRSWFLAEGSFLRKAGETLFSARVKVDGAGAAPRGNATELACTGGEQLLFAATGPATLNGAPFTGERREKAVYVPALEPRAVPEPPRAPGGPRFEIEPPPPPLQASMTLQVLPPDAALPAGSVRVEAEEFSAQGGGGVEVTDRKVGASGRSFFHWDHAGHWVEWKVPVARAGRYQLLIRACTAEARALRKLTVNGKTPPGAEAMELRGTGGYSNERDDWRTFVTTGADGRALLLDLPAGEATIRLENIDGESLNLDWIALAPAAE
ncbi:MAG TPA: heparinase II/III family protein [Armatimonadota bacterium]|nr:heparinase II/III family protein [Armatimonadota bacterium]